MHNCHVSCSLFPYKCFWVNNCKGYEPGSAFPDILPFLENWIYHNRSPYHKCVFSFLLPGVPGFLKDIKVELEKGLLSKLEFQASPKSIFFSPIENNCQSPWHNKVIRCFKDKKDENEPVTRKMMTFKDNMHAASGSMKGFWLPSTI